MRGLLSWVDGLGVRPNDPPNVIPGKQNVARSAALMVVAVVIFAAQTAAFGERAAVVTCLVTAITHGVSLWLFARDGNLKNYAIRMGPITFVTTPLLRFTARGIPMTEFILFGALAWVVGVALTGHTRRTVWACVALFVMVLIVESAIRLFPPAVAHPNSLLALGIFMANTVLLAAVLCVIITPLAKGRRDLAGALAKEHERSERLLLNVLPPAIAERLKTAPVTIADRFEHASVLFADIVGFTPMSARMAPETLVKLLDEIFSEFDAIARRHRVEKIKTIGDAYMAAAGIPEFVPDHAERIASVALDMRSAVARWPELKLRIGVHSGPVVAGVIGREKFSYDLWGDTVNTAARLESHGIVGQIQVSDAVRAAVADKFTFESRGEIELKGKGPMQAFILTGRRDIQQVA